MDNYLETPGFFAQYCRICDFSEEQIQKSWQEIIAKTTDDFVDYIDHNLKDPDISKAIGNGANASDVKDIWVNVLQSLSDDKRKKVATDMIMMFSKNLDSFYEILKQKATIEQKQVIKAFANS